MMAQGLRCVPGTSTQFPWHRLSNELAAPLRGVIAKPVRSHPQIELQAIDRRVDHEKGCSRNIREGARRI
jgi:hypothetical protein